MNALALVALLSTSCLGECRSDDCGRCYKPHSHSVCRDWEAYWCNLAKPCDFRLMCTPWPLEYPGARGIGWMAEGTAVTKDFPINVGPHAVQVVIGENGVPKAIRRPIYTPPEASKPASPPLTNPQSSAARHQTEVASQSRYRFVE